MKVTAIRWTEDRIEHIARHGVEQEEAEEVFRARPLILRGRKDRGRQSYYALGRTAGGRYLAVIFRPLGGDEAFVITARDMSAKECRRYRRMRP